MATREKDFKQDVVIKALLWCARHCCLCGKACSTGIEVAHIDREGPGTLDNAIPLCFDCHERTGSYDPKHPRGRRYRPAELRERRECGSGSLWLRELGITAALSDPTIMAASIFGI